MRYFRLTVGWFFGLCVFFAAAVYVVDPFVRYRKPGFFKTIYSSANSRQMVPGVLRHFEYDSVVVGNSQAQNFSLKTIRDELGWNAVKATSPACSPRVLGRFMEIAFASRGAALTNVWLNMSVATYAGRLDFGNDDVTPYLYAADHWGDYRYLLNLDVLTQRVTKNLYATFGGGGERYARRTDPDNMFMLDFSGARARDYGEDKVRQAYFDDLAGSARKPGRLDMEKLLGDVEAHLLSHIRVHRNATFYIVLAPMTSIAWHQYAADGILDDMLAFTGEMLTRVAREPNALLIDCVSDPALACDLSLFRDTVHYSRDVDARLVAHVKSVTPPVAEAGVPALIERLRALAAPELQPAWVRQTGGEN